MTEHTLSERQNFILVGMVASEDFYPVRFTSVQVQKLFFLLDQKVRIELNEKPYFNFEPYDYGPFDKTVYEEVEKLAEHGYVEIKYIHAYAGLRKEYNLTRSGIRVARDKTALYDENLKQIISDSVQRVLSHRSFKSLLMDIYQEYPKMRENSIFT